MTDRDPTNGKFVKGNKANPGGRPRSDITLIQLIDSVVKSEDWEAIIKKILVKAKNGDMKAMELLLDRRFGKPLQQTENKHEGTLAVVVEWGGQNADNPEG